jgi:uncharacterized protein (TIGR02596 family)
MKFPRPQRRNHGFSMVELIVVLAIIAIVAAMVTLPTNLWRSETITTIANQVTGDLAYARELSIANNQPVEAWFLRPTGGTSITGLQIYLIDQTGSAAAYGAVRHLPLSLGIDSGSYLSPILVTGNQKTFGGTQVQPTIPGYGTSYQVWYVRFMPDGSTTLQSTQQWYLTLHDITLGDNLTKLPANYAMISIDPTAGTVNLYRP